MRLLLGYRHVTIHIDKLTQNRHSLINPSIYKYIMVNVNLPLYTVTPDRSDQIGELALAAVCVNYELTFTLTG